MESESVTLI